MASQGVPMPDLGWDCANEVEAYEEWKAIIDSNFVIQKLSGETKWHYIILSSGSRGKKRLNT